MEERITRDKATRLKCLDCCCGSSNEVKLCTMESVHCILFAWALTLTGLKGSFHRSRGSNSAKH